MNGYTSKRKILSIIAAGMLVAFSFASCTKNPGNGDGGKNDGESPSNNAADVIDIPDNKDNEEEVVVNENYAESELYDFTGTVDEIYEDGSILVYSPDFGVNFNYMVIVEFDENSVIDNFELAVNQHVAFEVYSLPKKANPLTVVAAKLTLLNEVSTQRQEEEAKRNELEKQVIDTIDPNYKSKNTAE